MEDTDLRGLDLAAAKEYIFAFAVEIKKLDKDIAAARAEAELWKGRITLAEGKGMADLATAARAKAEEAAAKVANLEAEQASLRSKVARMREQLPMISARERSIDPDRLLAELQLLTGELLGPGDLAQGAGGSGMSAAATEKEFSKLEANSAAEAALAALKEKSAGGTGDGGDSGAPGPRP